MISVLVAASPAWAQDTPPATESARAAVVAPPTASADEIIRRGDELARLRGRGATRAVIGGVMLAFGVVLAGVSALLWDTGGSTYGEAGLNAYYQGAVAMDTIAFGLIGGGTTLLAVGAGNIAESKRPRLFIGAASIGAHF